VERRLTRIAGTPRIRVVAFLSAAALLAAPGNCQESEDSIQGQIRVTNGGTLPSGMTVRLEEAENVVVAQQMVGDTGKFAFYGLKKQSYQVIVTAEGYQPGTAPVDMQYYASRFPTIYLTPLGPKKTPPSPSANTTDLAVPKKARKEYQQGHDALQAKDWAGARTHFERAIEQDPCYARALTELGVVLSQQGELSSAEISFQKSIHCDGEFLEPYIQLGILLDIEKKYSESESILQQGLRVAQSDWQLYYRLGDAHQGLGKYKEAEQEYLKAESLSASVPPEVHVRLADAYLQQKEYDQAYTEMQTYLRIAPEGPLAGQTRSFLQRVDSMRKSDSKPASPQ
jgi:tetratricopeptide (TPR) repeat protein